jgi:hypothetical protein
MFMLALIKSCSHRTLQSGVPPSPARGESDLLVVGIPVWFASVARVALGVCQHEVFGAEATLALACAIGIPWLLASALVASPGR